MGTFATTIPKSQLNCLTEAVYHEARGEPELGQKLVAKTILQRKSSSKFPNTVCGVINQKGQFSYKTKRGIRVRELSTYKKIEQLVKAEVKKFSPSKSNPLYFYNPKKVKPGWAKKMKVLKRAGNHVFLRPM
jgi:spore germination cell wall hydrolase CwlJ-like protein